MRYFKEVNRSRSWFVIGGFRSILFVCCFWMTVTIMIDGRVKKIVSLALNFRVRVLLKSAISLTQVLCPVLISFWMISGHSAV